MTKTERATLLRERMRAVRGFDLKITPCKRKPWYPPLGRDMRGDLLESVGQHVREIRQPWVRERDEIEEIVFKESHRHGAHALTKMAMKLRRGWQR